ncbi:MAG: outer membrane beta-barrel protein [Steroidobacteraceae bacterium]
MIVGLTLVSPASAQEASGQEVPHRAFFDTDANTGGYAGVTLGESDLDIDAGALARSNSLITQGRPVSFELVGGYRPAPFWSGELAYLRLGQASAGKNYTQTRGYMLSALVYLPTPYINLYGRLGALEWNSYGRCNCAAGVAVPIHFRRSGLSAAYGVGGTTNGRGNLNLRLEWDKLKISDARRANLVTVGLIWSFF